VAGPQVAGNLSAAELREGPQAKMGSGEMPKPKAALIFLRCRFTPRLVDGAAIGAPETRKLCAGFRGRSLVSES
jgi:hypothetical protein